MQLKVHDLRWVNSKLMIPMLENVGDTCSFSQKQASGCVGRNECISTMKSREKWAGKGTNLALGDLVLLCDSETDHLT